jgi:hypothetical protein
MSMTIAIYRGLLPVLFCVISLVLSVHPATAFLHAPTMPPILVLEPHGHDQQAASHAMHSVSCCSLAAALPASEFGVVLYAAPRAAFAIRASDVAIHPGIKSEHYRPPRLA